MASLLSIVIGLVLGFVLLVLLNPGASVGGMKAMMTTGFSSMDKLGKVLYQAAPLMMCGLSVGFAFKTGLFNIGASGQYTMGAFFALLCAIQFQMPWFVCLLAGAARRCALGRLPGPVQGVLQCQRGHHRHHVQLDRHEPCEPAAGQHAPTMLAPAWGASNSDRTAALADCQPWGHPAQAAGCLTSCSAIRAGSTSAIIIAIVVAVLVWVVLQKTTFGYELKACGLNRDAAQYAGINAKTQHRPFYGHFGRAVRHRRRHLLSGRLRVSMLLEQIHCSAWASTAFPWRCWPAPTPSARSSRRFSSAIFRSAARPCSPALLLGDHRHRDRCHHLSGGLCAADARRDRQGKCSGRKEEGRLLRNDDRWRNIISLTISVRQCRCCSSRWAACSASVPASSTWRWKA